MEAWPEISQAAERLTLVGLMALLIVSLISDRFLWTAVRGKEWRSRCETAEARAERAEEALRANNHELKSLTTQVEISNKTLSDILKALLHNTDRR